MMRSDALGLDRQNEAQEQEEETRHWSREGWKGGGVEKVLIWSSCGRRGQDSILAIALNRISPQ